MLKVYVMRGLPGSGKSTFAKYILSKENETGTGVILSTDDYFHRRIRNEDGEWVDIYDYDASLVGDAHEWNRQRFREAIAQRRTPIVVDNTNVCEWEARPYVRYAVENQYYVQLVTAQTPWARNAAELARRNSHNVPKRRIEQMFEKWEEFTVESCLQ